MNNINNAMFSVNRLLNYKSCLNRIANQKPAINFVLFCLKKQFYHNNNLKQGSTELIIKESLPNSQNFKQKTEIPRELIHKDDPDRFGVLSGTAIFTSKYDSDIGDKEEDEYLTERPHYLPSIQYAKLMKEELKNKRLKNALDILEIKMLKEDRAKPDKYIYSILISGCAAVGYTKKAFMLFNDMKKRNLKISGGIYTSLFNACANSPWPEDGLKRATQLRELMFEKHYEPNITNYNAMIKAFGRCGDLKTAFMLVDEMIDKRLNVPISTMNFLLQASISDKIAGFRHGLLVWRKILHMKKKPDVYTFNLLLHCIRDCGLGDIEESKSFFDNLNEGSKRLDGPSNQILLNSPSNNSILKTQDANEVENNLPNLLSQTPHFGKIVDITGITNPEHRLLLLGGASGFLKEMYVHKAVPDLKTFTQLLQVIPSTNAAETALLRMMKKTGIKVDVCFFNMLMKKRVLRYEYESAKEVLNMIKTAGLKPDIITYGVLAMTCQSKFEARDLLDDISGARFRGNAEIMGAMLNVACKKISFGYVLLIMEEILNEDIEPNKYFYTTLENFYQKCKRCSEELANNVSCEDLKHINRDYFLTLYPKFSNSYKSWIDKVQTKYPNCDIHPWDQYRKPIDDGFEGRKIFEKRRKIKKRFIRAIA